MEYYWKSPYEFEIEYLNLHQLGAFNFVLNFKQSISFSLRVWFSIKSFHDDIDLEYALGFKDDKYSYS